jgi:hypothetical protein
VVAIARGGGEVRGMDSVLGARWPVGIAYEAPDGGGCGWDEDEKRWAHSLRPNTARAANLNPLGYVDNPRPTRRGAMAKIIGGRPPAGRLGETRPRECGPTAHVTSAGEQPRGFLLPYTGGQARRFLPVR